MIPVRVDEPGTRCSFDSHDCSALLSGHGGFDAHHRWPKEMGGAEHQSDMLTLCPNHHRRQHSLIRYLVECTIAGVNTHPAVTRKFAPLEWESALYALTAWTAAGQPTIAAWSAPAAR